MSVQFRTSQKDLITKINAADSRAVGVCCNYNSSTGSTKSISTPLQCYLNNGTFFYGDLDTVECPHSGGTSSTILGCCCACSIAKDDPNYETYIGSMTPIDSFCETGVPSGSLNNFGMTRMTQCECERIGGKFTVGECPTSNPLTSTQSRQYCWTRTSIFPPPPPIADANISICASEFVQSTSQTRYFTYDFRLRGLGTINVDYDFYAIPDRMLILYPAPIDGATYADATVVDSTGSAFVTDEGTLSFLYNPYLPNDQGYTATYEKFVIGVQPSTVSGYSFTVSCPSGDVIPPGTNAGFSCDVDIRLPRSCCYFDYDINGYPIGVSCENVCNPRECELKSISTQPSAYSYGTICPPNVLSDQITPNGDYSCNNVVQLMASGSNLFRDIQYGNCYRLIDNGSAGYSYDCEITAEFFCYDGYWVPAQNENDFCFNNSVQPQIPLKSARKVEPEKMTQEDFTASNINIGDFYKGGIYIGTYYPGSPLSSSGSDIFGSKLFSYGSTMKSDASGAGEKTYNKWAIFIEPFDYKTSLYASDEKINLNFNKLSSYDGFYNCYGNGSSFSGIKNRTTNTIVGKDRKGFVDFYIPSLNEMMFITEQIRKNKYLANKLNMFGTYMTSSSYNNFMYTQYVSSNPIITGIFDAITDFGRLLLAQPTTPVSFRFIRKIILT